MTMRINNIWLVTLMLAALGLAGCATQPEEVVEQPLHDLVSKKQQADAAYAKGHLDMALKHYVLILSEQPDNFEVMYRVGVIQEQKQEYNLAAKAYEDVLELQPDHMPAKAASAVMKLRQGDNEEALAQLLAVKQIDQQRLTASSQEEAEVIVPVAFAALDEASPLQCYVALGILFDLKGLYEPARQMYQAVLSVDSANVNALNNLGYSHYLSGEFALAERYLRELIQKHPEFERAWTNLALVYMQTDRQLQAARTLSKVKGEASTMNDLGYFALLRGSDDEARQFFQQAIDISPSYYQKAHENLTFLNHRAANKSD